MLDRLISLRTSDIHHPFIRVHRDKPIITRQTFPSGLKRIIGLFLPEINYSYQLNYSSDKNIPNRSSEREHSSRTILTVSNSARYILSTVDDRQPMSPDGIPKQKEFDVRVGTRREFTVHPADRSSSESNGHKNSSAGRGKKSIGRRDTSARRLILQRRGATVQMKNGHPINRAWSRAFGYGDLRSRSQFARSPILLPARFAS